ncbi:linear amide C-N hydrolase, partial [Roseibium sp. RKSG952]|uniref:linear amide C-N hydrolase n=1 Tax=Roseibium sp. RKSG952 TaxID=2529384 RepID=UPI001FCA5D38
MEFGKETESSLSLVPKGFRYEAGTGVVNPMSWNSKFAVIGASAFGDSTLIADGINEAGLAGGILYFPKFAKYPDQSSVPSDKALAVSSEKVVH